MSKHEDNVCEKIRMGSTPAGLNVCEKIQGRAEVGLRKYGVSVERGDLSLRAWLQHLQEELMDATVYLEKLMSMLPDEPLPTGNQATLGDYSGNAEEPVAES